MFSDNSSCITAVIMGKTRAIVVKSSLAIERKKTLVRFYLALPSNDVVFVVVIALLDETLLIPVRSIRG